MNIPKLLRRLRRKQRIPQHVVADDLHISISEISRIERGRRRLRIDQAWDWFSSLGYHAIVVFWEKEEHTQELSDEDRELLAEVASALPVLPPAVRKSLVYEMRIWKEDAHNKLSSK